MPHLPKRRTQHGTPKVHRGFYQAWCCNSFDERVTNRIGALIESGDIDAHTTRIYITGLSQVC